MTFVVCLGSKRWAMSTVTDLALLAALADRMSAELLRFDQEEIICQSRRMQESLRRYVPSAVVAELSAGRDLEEGRREVSVLFVDIRGYSRFSEGRSANEVFSTVNRYTRCVPRS